jgi:Cys-rich four helix bundle protein (predicted Tat secretion target)
MERRDVLLGLGSATLGAMVASGAAAAQPADRKLPVKPVARPKKPDPREILLATLATCIDKGQQCAAHCARQLASGQVDFGNCEAKVHQMLALCGALQILAAREAELAKKAALLCAEACKACIAACAEHKTHFAHGMHLECKACLEACESCDKACVAYAA